MIIRHSERVHTFGEAVLRQDPDYSTVVVEYVTPSGIAKQLEVTESEASRLAAALADVLEGRPAEGRAERFAASIRAARKPIR